MPKQWPPPRRKPPASSDDTLIKVVGGVILVACMVGGVRWYRGSHDAAALAAASAQAQQQAVLGADASRLAQQARDAQAPAGQTRLTLPDNHPVSYKCRDAAGTFSIQDWPCDAATQTEWTPPAPDVPTLPREAREAAEASQRAADIARHEAEVAQYTQVFGDRPAPRVYSSGPQPVGPAERCAAAKRYRDDIYRQAGNNRSFNLIRQLDDYVYEACKSN